MQLLDSKLTNAQFPSVISVMTAALTALDMGAARAAHAGGHDHDQNARLKPDSMLLVFEAGMS